MACTQCQAWMRSERVYGAEAWTRLRARLDHALGGGVLELLSGNVPADVLTADAPWPGESLKLTCACRHCDQLFVLEMGPWKTRSGEWRALA